MTAMTIDEMKKLLAETMDAQFQADSFSDDEPSRATANPPATDKEIARLSAALKKRGLSLPPSYQQFLRIHDGIEDFLPSIELSMRSCEDVIDSYEEDVDEWKRISPAYKFVFASGDTTAFAGFVPDSVDAQGEMRVVMFNESGEKTDYASFQRFLEDQLSYYRDVIKGELADRADLEDD